jgi:hypothetical protein
MGIAEQLDAAADLLEKGWAQGHDAETSDGESVELRSVRATCFCAAAAIERKCGDSYYAGLKLLEQVVGGGVVTWNDAPERTQAEVVAAVRKAAELARVSGTPQENVEAKSQ